MINLSLSKKKFGVNKQKRRVQTISVFNLDSLKPLYFFSTFLDFKKNIFEIKRIIVITISKIEQTEIKINKYLFCSVNAPRSRISVLINDNKNTSDSSVKHEISKNKLF